MNLYFGLILLVRRLILEFCSLSHTFSPMVQVDVKDLVT